jgi:hypothetical protein
LGKILNDLEELSSGLFLLEKFASEGFDLGPIKEARGGGGHSQGQGDGS